MKVAFVFPGQGIDVARVVGEWVAFSPRVRELVDVAAAATGEPASRLASGAGIALRRTECYQPVLTAVAIGALSEQLARGHRRPDMVAGHSLGEIAACVAAGAIAPEAAVALAATRGRLMARESARHPGGMVAIRAATRAAAEAIAAAARAHGSIVVAAHNAPEDWVLSGDHAALRAIPTGVPHVPLATDGAWHSPAMEGAVDEYREALRGAVTGALKIPIVCNRDGQVTAAESLVDALAGQLVRPIEWATTMETLAARGVRDLVTIGPAKALRSLDRGARARRQIEFTAYADVPSELPAVPRQVTA